MPTKLVAPQRGISSDRATYGEAGSPTVADYVRAERYLELLKDAKVKGYLYAQTHYIEKK